MTWQLYRPADRDDLIAFLSKEEWGHVGFSSNLKEAKESASPHIIYIRRKPADEARVCEAVLCTQGGLLIPVLSRCEPPFRSDLHRMLLQKKRKGRFNTVMGLRRDVESVQVSIERPARAAIIYHAMATNASPPAVPSHTGILCKRGKPRDTDTLYPLQKAYEIEEVLLDPATFNSSACYLNLQKILRRQIVYYALLDGKIVAKAGTNARGYSFSQLGGVYTLEGVRNRGVAETVLSVLLQEIFKAGTGASLFVKKDNTAAIALYKKLGFSIHDEFKIAYY